MPALRRLIPFLAFLLLALPLAAQEAPKDFNLRQLLLGDTARLLDGVARAKGVPGSGFDQKQATCVIQNIACNTSVSSTLTDQDCGIDDGTFVDFWEFQGEDGMQVTINLTSNEFDTFLFLIDPTPVTTDVDDDGGTGTNSLINATLNSTGPWTIGVNGFEPADLGNYNLQLDCSGGGGPPPPPPSSCAPGATTMCLNNDRFQVEVDWRDFNGNTGSGNVVPVASDDSGLFWFFSPDNWEMLIKVLDGCSITDHFWVFAAATTNVEYTIRVTDTETSLSKTYFNPLGNSASAITDTSALPVCP